MAETPKKTPKHHIDTNNLFVYLQTGRYLPGTSENSKRNLRKRAKSFKIIEEKLYYVSSHTDNQGNVIEAERLVLREKEEQLVIVAQLHVDEKGCHLGREKLTGKISEKYYFLGISTMVRQYISECAYCQVHRPSHKSSSDGNLSGSAYSDTGDGEDSENSCSFSTSSVEDTKPLANEWMMTMPDPHRFWEIVEMNVMGPYDCDNSQYYIIVFLDIFSKWPEAFVVDNLSPSVVTHLILNLVCRFGCMKTLTLKQCTAFAMEEMHPREDILQKANLEITVNHQKSTLPCPIWSEIKGSIQQFTENNSHWPYCLEFALLPHRISRAESCEYTPSYITYGRELNLPQSLSHKEEDSSSSMFHSAEPHLTSDQMSVTQENLLQAYNMYGKFSEWNQTLNKMTKPLYPSSTSGQTKNSNSKSTVGSSSKRKRKSTFNAENIYYSYDSDDVSEKEIEEDMPPPVSTAGSKEVLTGASKRKRSKQVRLVAQDSNEEDGTVDGNKAQDDPKDVNYASGEKAVEKQRRVVDTIQLKGPTKKYVCNVCNKEVSRSDVLRRHMREMHEVHESSINICPECGICIKRRQHLKRHILKVHQNKSDTFDCKVCGKSFSQKVALRQHVTSVHENELYNCEQCKRNYTTKSGLKVHIAQEHEQKYPCPICGKCSGSSSLFNKHLATHQGNDIKCPHCKLSFTSKELFLAHRDDCRVAQQYTCIMCGKIFHSKNAFQQHEATHYDGKYPCHYCGLQFSFCTNLNRHLRTVHGRVGDKSDEPGSEPLSEEGVYSELISPASIRALLAQVSESTLKIPNADGSDTQSKGALDDMKPSGSQDDSITSQEASKASSAIQIDVTSRQASTSIDQAINSEAGQMGENGTEDHSKSQSGGTVSCQPSYSDSEDQKKDYGLHPKETMPSQSETSASSSQLWGNSIGGQATDQTVDEKGDLSSIHVWGNSLPGQNENHHLEPKIESNTPDFSTKYLGIQTLQNENGSLNAHNSQLS